MAPRSQEEGDTRAFARLRIMAHTAVTAKIVYTDFVEIGLAIFQMISGLQDLLIEFGSEKKKKKKNYAIQKLNLKNWSWKIHALSGCKKQNLWNTWNNFVEVT